MEVFSGEISIVGSELEQPLRKQSPVTTYASASVEPVTQRQASTNVWRSSGGRTITAAGHDWQTEPLISWKSGFCGLVSILMAC